MINVCLCGFRPCSLFRLLRVRGSAAFLREHQCLVFILSNFFLFFVLKGEIWCVLSLSIPRVYLVRCLSSNESFFHMSRIGRAERRWLLRNLFAIWTDWILFTLWGAHNAAIRILLSRPYQAVHNDDHSNDCQTYKDCYKKDYCGHWNLVTSNRVALFLFGRFDNLIVLIFRLNHRIICSFIIICYVWHRINWINNGGNNWIYNVRNRIVFWFRINNFFLFFGGTYTILDQT